MFGIEIKNGVKRKCPNCGSIFAIENETEILYRSITLLYFDTVNNKAEIKCKQCKNIIKIDLSDQNGRLIKVE